MLRVLDGKWTSWKRFKWKKLKGWVRFWDPGTELLHLFKKLRCWGQVILLVMYRYYLHSHHILTCWVKSRQDNNDEGVDITVSMTISIAQIHGCFIHLSDLLPDNVAKFGNCVWWYSFSLRIVKFMDLMIWSHFKTWFLSVSSTFYVKQIFNESTWEYIYHL